MNNSNFSKANNHNGYSNSLPISPIQSPNKLNRHTQEQKHSIAHLYTEQALIYFKESNWRKAIIACKNALDTTPDCADAYKILGDVLYRQGKKADALGIYAKALAINPNLASVYANVGTLYAGQQQWQKARDYYQQAIIIDPSLAGAYRNLAKVWEELGDSQKALECFCQAINLEPETLTPKEYFDFGRKLYQQGKTKEASILFTQGVKLDPQAKTELVQLIQMLEKLGESQQAVAYYHQLISLKDCPESTYSNKPIRKLLSGSNNLSSKKENAQKIKQESILPSNNHFKLMPKVENNTNSAKLLPQSQNTTSINVPVIDLVEFKQEPDSPISWNNMGSLYAQKKQWIKAISCYQKAIQLNPDFVKSYRNLAKVYKIMGEIEKAALCYYEAFAIEPDSVKPEVYFNLAETLLQYQQKDKAIACLQKVVQLKPDFDWACLTLENLLESSKKFNSQIELLNSSHSSN